VASRDKDTVPLNVIVSPSMALCFTGSMENVNVSAFAAEAQNNRPATVKDRIEILLKLFMLSPRFFLSTLKFFSAYGLRCGG
jgi:hypothetical protein